MPDAPMPESHRPGGDTHPETLPERALRDAVALRETPLYFKTNGGSFFRARRCDEIADTLEALEQQLSRLEQERAEAQKERDELHERWLGMRDCYDREVLRGGRAEKALAYCAEGWPDAKEVAAAALAASTHEVSSPPGETTGDDDERAARSKRRESHDALDRSIGWPAVSEGASQDEDTEDA